MPAGNTDRAHHDEPNEEQASGFKRGTKASAESSGRTRIRDLVHVPAPVKRVFDRFPVVTYPANPLPLHTSSTQSARDVPTLYIFVDREDAHLGKPSFNPGCLKWQVRQPTLQPPPPTLPFSSGHTDHHGALRPFSISAVSSSRSYPPTITLLQAGLSHSSSHLALYQHSFRADPRHRYLPTKSRNTFYSTTPHPKSRPIPNTSLFSPSSTTEYVMHGCTPSTFRPSTRRYHNDSTLIPQQQTHW